VSNQEPEPLVSIELLVAPNLAYKLHRAFEHWLRVHKCRPSGQHENPGTTAIMRGLAVLDFAEAWADELDVDLYDDAGEEPPLCPNP